MMLPTSLLNCLDWEPLNETGIDLTAEQIDRAMQLSQPIADPDQQWQTYLHWLALLGFEQWLSERSPDLIVDFANCALFQPQITSLLGSVCNLQVGEFKVGLIATGSLADTVVHVPRAMLDLPEYAAQFYIWVEVLEEQQQMQIQGYLRADQLQSQQVVAQSDHTYRLSVDWFSLDADNLLLNLRCLEPTAIPLPALQTRISDASGNPATVEQVQQKLANVTAQPESANRSLHQLFTWEEIITLLAHPEWLKTSIRVVDSIFADLQTNIVSSPPSVADNILNVATWFQGQLGEFAQQLAWVLLPPVIQPLALRSTVAEWDLLLDNLMQNGLTIPETAARAYRDLEWEGSFFRLHAITWALKAVASEVEPEWVLLIVLGGQPNTRLPLGSRLQVCDATQTLVAQELTDADRLYLYAQVVGNQDEQFWVSIGSNTAMLSLPPFAFRP